MAGIQRYKGIRSLCMQTWGKMLLLGVKTPFSEEREALKTIWHCCTRQNLSIDGFCLKSDKVDFWSNFTILPSQSSPKTCDFRGATHPGELRGLFHTHFVQLIEWRHLSCLRWP
jgi:hypothetical protein